MRSCAALAPVLLTAWLLVSCTGAPPELVGVELSLEYVDNFDLDRRYEQLTLYALVRDQDGFADIRELYLIHDEAELYWHFDPDSWTHRRLAGENWIGFDGLTMGDWSALPRGRYRVVVIDASGEQDERAVAIDAPPFSAVEHQLPQLNRTENSINVVGAPALLYVVSDDAAHDDHLSSPGQTLAPGEHAVAELLADQRSVSEGYLYVPLGSYYGSLSGPIRR
ncbi:MAG: hypothetical protein EA384_12940 [Spirochaetaceae bacterium]|nr:MAG: hypothetical protein EA384_12940 [Spirochaetaceae bacterium]